jgi:hypothetical protein
MHTSGGTLSAGLHEPRRPSSMRLSTMKKLAALLLPILVQMTGRAGEPPAAPVAVKAVAENGRQTKTIEGWTVHISDRLLHENKEATLRAVELLTSQLADIVKIVPSPAVAQLRKVPLWVSPEYAGVQPRAEYHPDAGWLRAHGRDPVMAKGIEFTNVRIFELETKRMPVFALHELAHAYHDRVLGFDHPEIIAAYKLAVASDRYGSVERWHGNGRPNTRERAYAMTDEKEYFAECSEAFFGRNDFFPFTRDELEKHDPGMFTLLGRLWNLPAPK